MPEGTFRRPPQIWEQKIANLVAVNTVGSISGSGTVEVGPDLPPGDGGPPPEAAPITPTPAIFIKPSTPILIGGIQGINVLWDGLTSTGQLWPYESAWVEIHMSTSGATFTPTSATYQGRLARPGSFFVGGLTAGTTYYFRLVGATWSGAKTEPSDAASGQTGLTQTSDYGTGTISAGAVSFNARAIGGITTTVGTTAPTSPVTGDIWLDSTGGVITHKRWSGSAWVTQAWGSDSLSANCITATQIAAGAVTAGAIAANAILAEKINAGAITAEKIAALAITADKIAAGTITADKLSVSYLTATDVGSGGSTVIDGGRITSGTITGRLIRTATSGKRIEIQSSGTYNGEIEFYNSSGTKRGSIYGAGSYLTIDPPNGVEILGNMYMNLNYTLENLGLTRLGYTTGGQYGIRVPTTGEVYSYGIDENTTGNAANVRIGNNAQLLKSTSTVRAKDELAPVTDDLAGVPPEKLADFPASIDPYDVLTITPTEFRSLSKADADARMFGFIAEDVAVKLPWAANWDEEGQPSAVEDRPILAALLAVVKEQQQTIANLTARVEALEAK